MEAQKSQPQQPSPTAATSCHKKKSEEATFLEDLKDHMDEFIHASMEEHKNCFKKTMQKVDQEENVDDSDNDDNDEGYDDGDDEDKEMEQWSTDDEENADMDEEEVSEEHKGQMDEDEDEEEEEGDEGKNYVLKDAELEELEKEYMGLRQQEENLLKNLKHHKDEELQKGQAVKNQQALWDKSLEFRFLIQKAFSTSNRLPQEPARSSFCSLDKGVGAAYSDLISASKNTLNSLLELQEALLQNNRSISVSSDVNILKSSKLSSGDYQNMGIEQDDEWEQIVQMQKRIAAFRDKSLDKWQRKTQVTSGAAAIRNKLQAFNQNISEQVATYMRDPIRMIKQMQQRRSSVAVFGSVCDAMEGSRGEETTGDGDPELVDDSEFYQQLLKEFFETVDPTSSETALYALKRMQAKKRKVVDRRASKSRKIRYHVHEKIVNFMAPQPVNLLPMAPKLFENLFGLRKQGRGSET